MINISKCSPNVIKSKKNVVKIYCFYTYPKIYSFFRKESICQNTMTEYSYITIIFSYPGRVNLSSLNETKEHVFYSNFKLPFHGSVLPNCFNSFQRFNRKRALPTILSQAKLRLTFLNE